jgi:hypothetical protein
MIIPVSKQIRLHYIPHSIKEEIRAQEIMSFIGYVGD